MRNWSVYMCRKQTSKNLANMAAADSLSYFISCPHIHGHISKWGPLCFTSVIFAAHFNRAKNKPLEKEHVSFHIPSEHKTWQFAFIYKYISFYSELQKQGHLKVLRTSWVSSRAQCVRMFVKNINKVYASWNKTYITFESLGTELSSFL